MNKSSVNLLKKSHKSAWMGYSHESATSWGLSVALHIMAVFAIGWVHQNSSTPQVVVKSQLIDVSIAVTTHMPSLDKEVPNAQTNQLKTTEAKPSWSLNSSISSSHTRSVALQSISPTLKPVPHKEPQETAQTDGNTVSAEPHFTSLANKSESTNELAMHKTAKADPVATPLLASPATPAGADANYLNNPKPAYPELARLRREEGVVQLRVQVQTDGVPSRVVLHSSSGYKLLDAAAERAVLKWRFVPANVAGNAAVGWVIVPIAFSLRSS